MTSQSGLGSGDGLCLGPIGKAWKVGWQWLTEASRHQRRARWPGLAGRGQGCARGSIWASGPQLSLARSGHLPSIRPA